MKNVRPSRHNQHTKAIALPVYAYIPTYMTFVSRRSD